jgi:hypothetical protein
VRGVGVIIITTDPITGEEIRNPKFKPYVIEGSGHLAVKIHFESEETRRQYLNRARVDCAAGSRPAKVARARNRRDRDDVTTQRPLPTNSGDGSLSGAMS